MSLKYFLSPRKFAPIAVIAAFATASALFAAFPEKPIKIIVPTNAGGEVDTLARIFQRAFEEEKLLPKKTVVINLPGAGGVIGTRKIKESPADGYTIGVWHPGIITSKLMGTAKFDHTAFDIIAWTGTSDVGLVTKSGSKLKSARDLVTYSKAEPKSIKVATNIGLPVHFYPLLFANTADIEFRFIQIGGGAKRLAAILGEHTDIALFSTPGMVAFRESGVEPLLIFGEERNPLLPEIPTAKELGYDLTLKDTRLWLAPKGVPLDRIEIIRTAIAQAIETEHVKENFKTLGMAREFGDASTIVPVLETLSQRLAPLVAKARQR